MLWQKKYISTPFESQSCLVTRMLHNHFLYLAKVISIQQWMNWSCYNKSDSLEALKPLLLVVFNLFMLKAADRENLAVTWVDTSVYYGTVIANYFVNILFTGLTSVEQLMKSGVPKTLIKSLNP